MNIDPRGFPEIDLAADAVFLDFDGTLVDIARRPDAVSVPADLPALLARLDEAASGALAVISGRALDTLEGFLHGFSGRLVGSHGVERRGEGAPDLPEGLRALQSDIRRIAARHGLLAEMKPYGGALHFRDAPDRQEAALQAAEALARTYPAFAVQPAKMAVELKPKGAAKDAALGWLMGLPEFAGRRPVYAGDDATDEPAMALALSHGGTALKIGPGDTAAPFRLDSPRDLRAHLARLVGAK